MSAEHLNHFNCIEGVCLATAVLWLVKQQIKAERRPNIDPSRLEIHHIDPIHNGGGDERDNLEALTKVEHAQRHFRSALQSKYDWDFAQKEFWSVRLIVQRMNLDEIEEFNRSINND